MVGIELSFRLRATVWMSLRLARPFTKVMGEEIEQIVKLISGPRGIQDSDHTGVKRQVLEGSIRKQ